MTPEEIANEFDEYDEYGDTPEFRSMMEIICTKSNLPDYNKYNNDWIVIREDDPEFEEIVDKYDKSTMDHLHGNNLFMGDYDNIREVRNIDLYFDDDGNGSTRYDMDGPIW